MARRVRIRLERPQFRASAQGRVETSVEVPDGASGADGDPFFYTRRRVGGSSDADGRQGKGKNPNKYRVYDSKPVGQVMLSGDAALRKAITRVRQSACIGKIPTDPKKRKTCTVKELKSDGQRNVKTARIFGLWRTFMKRDHGIALGIAIGSRKLDRQVGLVDKLLVNRDADGWSTIFTIKYKTTDDQKEGCEIRSGWKFNFYEKCACSPLSTWRPMCTRT